MKRFSQRLRSAERRGSFILLGYVSVCLVCFATWFLGSPTGVLGSARTAAWELRRASQVLKRLPSSLPADVEVDPRVVCLGADALVRVSADEDSVVTIAGARVNPAVVRATREGRRRVPIEVAGRDGSKVTIQAALDVVNCDDARAGMVVLTRNLGQGRVEAHVARPRPALAGPIHWDFGDGTAVDAESWLVEHDYSAASRLSPTTYIVSASATAVDGGVLFGRAHLAVKPQRAGDLEAREQAVRMLQDREARQERARAEEWLVPDPARIHSEQ